MFSSFPEMWGAINLASEDCLLAEDKLEQDVLEPRIGSGTFSVRGQECAEGRGNCRPYGAMR